MRETDSRPATEQAKPKLEVQAEVLMQLLLRIKGRDRACWPSREYLAREMGWRSVKSVSDWLQVLESRGLIEIDRTGRSNTFLIPPRSEDEQDLFFNRATKELEKYPAAGKKSTRLPGRKVPGCREEKYPAEGNFSTLLPGRKVPGRDEAPLDVIKFNKQQQRSTDNAAAAAEEISQEEIRVVEELRALGVPAPVWHIVKENPGLAFAVLVHCRFRFGCSHRLAPIANRHGYLKRCFSDPEACGFYRDDEGVWHTPANEPPARQQKAVDVEAKIQAQLERVRFWDGLPMAAQAKVKSFIREKVPLYASKTDGHDGFIMECRALAWQWHQEGKL